MFTNVGRNTLHELRASRLFRHLADIMTDEQHRIASVAVEQTMAILRFTGGTIDDGYKVICDDDAVLAFLSGVLGYAVLFDYFHKVWEYKDTTR